MLNTVLQSDWRSQSNKICQVVLGKVDYQLGKTRVFLKDSQDLHLEQERSKVLAARIIILQRRIRGWIQRRRYDSLRLI